MLLRGLVTRDTTCAFQHFVKVLKWLKKGYNQIALMVKPCYTNT